MIEELSFQVYLVISKKKFEIYLLDKQNLKNIFFLKGKKNSGFFSSNYLGENFEIFKKFPP